MSLNRMARGKIGTSSLMINVPLGPDLVAFLNGEWAPGAVAEWYDTLTKAMHGAKVELIRCHYTTGETEKHQARTATGRNLDLVMGVDNWLADQ